MRAVGIAVMVAAVVFAGTISAWLSAHLLVVAWYQVDHGDLVRKAAGFAGVAAFATFGVCQGRRRE